MKRKESGRTLFGAVILLLMMVLAGTVAFAAEELTYPDNCDLNPRSPYFPMILTKEWSPEAANHPNSVDVWVSYYPSRFHSKGEPARRMMVTLNEANDWTYSFPAQWDVQFYREDTEGYKPEIRISENPEDPEGRYLCTLVNKPAYSVTYEWTGLPEEDRDWGPQEPGEAWFCAGDEVQKHDRTYGVQTI